MNIQREKLWFSLVGASLLIHIIVVGSLSLVKIDKKRSYIVKVGIVDIVKTVPPKSDHPQKIIPPPQRKVTSVRKPETVKALSKAPKPIMGLDKTSLAVEKKSEMTGPLGNTLMTEDSGGRPVDTKGLENDLSARALLIQSSIIPPEYTENALDANLEGQVDVDVFVDKEGNVVKVDLAKKIGHGMDRRILKAARGAQFVPSRNRIGGPTEGWTSIRFNLRIP